MIKFGVVTQESKDKGPYKLGQVKANGKTMDVEFVDMTGVEGSPLKDSRCIIFSPDGDDGKAIAIVYGPPIKDRTDGQSPGDVTYKNHKTGNKVTYNKDGDTVEYAKRHRTEEFGGDQTTKAKGTIRQNGAKILLNC